MGQLYLRDRVIQQVSLTHKSDLFFLKQEVDDITVLDAFEI